MYASYDVHGFAGLLFVVSEVEQRPNLAANGSVLIAAIVLDVIVLRVFGAMKLESDPLIVAVAVVAIAAVFAYERVFLSRWTAGGKEDGSH